MSILREQAPELEPPARQPASLPAKPNSAYLTPAVFRIVLCANGDGQIRRSKREERTERPENLLCQSRGVRKSDAYAGAAGGVCGGGAQDFLADSWRLGKDGHTHIRLAAASQDVLTGALRTAWRLRIDKNAKTSRRNPHVAKRSGVTDKETREATTMRAIRARNINSNKNLSPERREELLGALKARFEKNMNRHKGLEWDKAQAKLEANAEKLWSLNEMERTGGEPDVVGHDKKTGEYIFYDCSAESPKGRRSVCYDREALESRKEHKPEDNAIDMAAAMGIELLTEEQYRELQKLGDFDTKTSSWVKTPSDIRKLGGGLFCDRRYDTVFVYHNGAESYYAARAFRGSLKL
jgi:hypothetical protein